MNNLDSTCFEVEEICSSLKIFFEDSLEIESQIQELKKTQSYLLTLQESIKPIALVLKNKIEQINAQKVGQAGAALILMLAGNALGDDEGEASWLTETLTSATYDIGEELLFDGLFESIYDENSLNQTYQKIKQTEQIITIGIDNIETITTIAENFITDKRFINSSILKQETINYSNFIKEIQANCQALLKDIPDKRVEFFLERYNKNIYNLIQIKCQLSRLIKQYEKTRDFDFKKFKMVDLIETFGWIDSIEFTTDKNLYIIQGASRFNLLETLTKSVNSKRKLEKYIKHAINKRNEAQKYLQNKIAQEKEEKNKSHQAKDKQPWYSKIW